MEYMVFILWLFDSNSWFPIPDPRYPIPDSWILGFLNSGMIRKRFQLIWNHNIWLLLKNKKLSKPFNFWLFMANMSVAPIDKEESKNNIFFFLFFSWGQFFGERLSRGWFSGYHECKFVLHDFEESTFLIFCQVSTAKTAIVCQAVLFYANKSNINSTNMERVWNLIKIVDFRGGTFLSPDTRSEGFLRGLKFFP